MMLVDMAAEPGRQSELDAISESATDEYLRRSSITFLECAISLMATHMTIAEVAEILRQEASIIEQYE